jgi:hypothetical protein
MTNPVFQKIYIILGNLGKEKLERVCRTLSFLFPHVNMTSSLYLVTENLPESMPQIKQIHKEIDKFLGEALFARLYVHYVHYVSTKGLEEIGLCYQYIKQMTGSFDKEGYIHQEMPRLMLLPVIVPDKQVESVPRPPLRLHKVKRFWPGRKKSISAHAIRENCQILRAICSVKIFLMIHWTC